MLAGPLDFSLVVLTFHHCLTHRNALPPLSQLVKASWQMLDVFAGPHDFSVVLTFHHCLSHRNALPPLSRLVKVSLF